NRSAGLFAMIPFSPPFVFGTNSNTNLNIDLLVFGRSAGASWSTDRGFASTSGMATTMGRGCGTGTINSTSTGGSYVAGSTINLTLTNASPNGVAWLLPSADMTVLLPGIPLPFDLGAVGGGSGCDVLVHPLLFLPTPVDAGGDATVIITLGEAARYDTAWQ